MRRTQIYLDEAQHSKAVARARRENRTLSEVVRIALDDHLKTPAVEPDWRAAVDALFGICKDDPEFEDRVLAARRSWDRDVFKERE
jgi:hypothetical protein